LPTIAASRGFAATRARQKAAPALETALGETQCAREDRPWVLLEQPHHEGVVRLTRRTGLTAALTEVANEQEPRLEVLRVTSETLL
jgi:hypothetical protein